MLKLDLLGWDTYPMILAGRVTDAAEFASTLTEELMKGRYPLGHFYRPVTHLAFALDYALWGLRPFGYHLTDLAILIASAVLAVVVALRLFGADLLFGGTFAGLAWALHPVHFEVLAAPPRRADSLGVLFTLLALWAQPRAGEERAPWRYVITGTCCLCAIGAKETGALAAGLVFVLAFASAEEHGWKTRGLHALRMTWPALVLVLAFVALRTAVLGGLGGSARATLVGGLTQAPDVALRYAQAVLYPRAVFGPLKSTGLPVGMAGVFVVLLLFVLVRRRRELRPGALLSLAGSSVFLAVWFAMLVIVTGISGLKAGWYSLPFLPVYCLLLGLVAGHGWAALHCGQRVLGASALLAAFGLFSLNGYSSGLFQEAPEFNAASQLAREFLERFEAEVRAAAPGARIRLGGYQSELKLQRSRAPTDKIYILAPYSLEAYGELRIPERVVHVELPGLNSGRKNRPDEVFVLLVPGSA